MGGEGNSAPLLFSNSSTLTTLEARGKFQQTTVYTARMRHTEPQARAHTCQEWIKAHQRRERREDGSVNFCGRTGCHAPERTVKVHTSRKSIQMAFRHKQKYTHTHTRCLICSLAQCEVGPHLFSGAPRNAPESEKQNKKTG